MSASELSEVYQLCTEIMEVLNGVNTATEKVVAQIPKIQAHEISLRKQIHMINLTINMVEQFSHSKTLSEFSQKIEATIMVMIRMNNILRVMNDLQTGLLTGPEGWILLGLNSLFMATSSLSLGQ
jgi:hypothetical protein